MLDSLRGTPAASSNYHAVPVPALRAGSLLFRLRYPVQGVFADASGNQRLSSPVHLVVLDHLVP